MKRSAHAFLIVCVVAALAAACQPRRAGPTQRATPPADRVPATEVAPAPTAAQSQVSPTFLPPTAPPTAPPSQPSPSPTLPPVQLSPSPTVPRPTATAVPSPTSPGPLLYPFEGRNMFFGVSMIKSPQYGIYTRELGVSWVSLQPHVLWFLLEPEPGVYNWAPLDQEVKWLQNLDLDITMVLHPTNLFGEARAQLAEKLKSQSQSDSYDDASATLMAFMRESPEAKQMRLYPHDETLPMWLRFVQAAVDRYDGDGKNDLPGLKYAVRNWHFVEEFPMPEWDSVQAYVDTLKVTYSAIKGEDPKAKIIIPGLAGNYSRFFAFADGFIQDPDAGVMKGARYTRQVIAANPGLKKEKAAYEYILREGKDYFDVADIHLYEEKETFVEGKIEYLKSKMREYGYSKPIWCIEGGGPLKDPPGKPTRHGDPYFGEWSAKENAEFVVKLSVLAAAKGVERNHWGLTATDDNSYWNGPWTVMALMTNDGQKKPAYYAFQMMAQKLKDFRGAKDLSSGDVRVIEFTAGDKKVVVAWSKDVASRPYDLSNRLGQAQVTVTAIATALGPDGKPAALQSQQASSTAVPLSITPAFIE